MSRLIDKLTRSTRAASQPMGFRTARADREEPKMLVIASLKPDTAGLAADTVAGADAVLLRTAKTRPSTKAIQSAIESIPDTPCGVLMENTGNTEALIKAGCDFIVFPDTVPVETVNQDDDTGKILRVEPSLEDSMVRVINNLPVDAVITGDSYTANIPLSWHDLMSIQRLGLLLTKPLLIPVSPDISPGELKALHEADVSGVVIEADPGKPNLLAGIRKTIGELPPRSAGKSGKAEPLLPYPGNSRQATLPDEEEEDYE